VVVTPRDIDDREDMEERIVSPVWSRTGGTHVQDAGDAYGVCYPLWFRWLSLKIIQHYGGLVSLGLGLKYAGAVSMGIGDNMWRHRGEATS
jgi:hypothetical protein